jgi:urease gamma subunit
MNDHARPTQLQETAYAEARQHLTKHLNQFKAECQSLQNLERNLPMLGNEAFKAALLRTTGPVIQTDDGTEWRQDIELMENVSVCHRRTAAGLEFAVVESLPLKSGEMKEPLNTGHSVREVLQTFVRDQRQVLGVWKDDVAAQVREYLAEKYPHQEMAIVVESFEIKLARAIAHGPTLAQNQSRGMRI